MKTDQLLYLLFCFSNSFFYVFIRYMHNEYPEYSTTEIASYTNYISLLCMMYYFISNFKHVLLGFKSNLRIAISAPSALLKFYAIQTIAPKNAMVISFLTPVMVTILSFLVLGETFGKGGKKQYLWMFLSFLGVVVFIGADIKFEPFAYVLMLLHISGKAFFHVFTKQLSKDRYLVLFYGVLYNAIFSTGSTIFVDGHMPNIKMLSDPKIIAIGIISLICQFALIQSYKLSTKISSLQNLDYSRIIFSCLCSYIMLGDAVNIRQSIGMVIIFASIILSEGKRRIARVLFIPPKKTEGRFRKHWKKYNAVDYKK